MLRQLIKCFIGCFLLVTLPAAAAEPTPRYNTVELQAQAQREVQNDLLIAVLFVELNDSNPAGLANAVNKSTNEALRIAKQYPSVRVRSGNNQTYPIYDDKNIVRSWRGRSEIRIESKDFESSTALISKLQASMQLANMALSVSPETRRTIENDLIVEAIGAFKARAEITKSALSGRRYKLLRLNLGTGNMPHMYADVAAMRTVTRSQGPTGPNIEAGTTVVTVSASGAIEILE